MTPARGLTRLERQAALIAVWWAWGLQWRADWARMARGWTGTPSKKEQSE